MLAEARSMKRHLGVFQASLLQQSDGANRFDKTLSAVAALQGALAAEFGATEEGAPTQEVKLARLQRRLKLVRNAWAKSKKELKAANAEKVSGRIQNLWIVRVAMTDPSIPAATLEQFCTNFPQHETQSASPTQIGAVRDAMAEILKRMRDAKVAKEVAALANGFGHESRTLFVLHVHDEAQMRLRSFDASLLGRSIRGRSSKVQNNCVSICFPNETVGWPTELQPLGRKTGAVLGQCIVDIISEIMRNVIVPLTPSWTCLRFVHVLVGDGVSTNQNAGRRALRFFSEHSRWGSTIVRYRLVMVQCASHAANLVVIVAICGELSRNAAEDDEICSYCSRFFKYFIPDYIEEFSFSLRTYLNGKFRVEVQEVVTEATQIGRQSARALQTIYGKSVLPDDLLDTFNKNLNERVTVVPTARDEAALANAAFQVLYTNVMVVEEKPVQTRFWLFADCVNTLLRMKLLDLPSIVFTLRMMSPSAEGGRRLARFHAWYDSEMAGNRLRVASICLQLTTHAVSISSQKTESKLGRVPIIIRLARGEVQNKTLQHLGPLLRSLTMDPDLDVLLALESLFVTQIHIQIRFDQYARFPYQLWRLSMRWNPVGCAVACEEFLDMDDGQLDGGYSLLLKREALSKGNLPDVLSFQFSSTIQKKSMEAP